MSKDTFIYYAPDCYDDNHGRRCIVTSKVTYRKPSRLFTKPLTRATAPDKETRVTIRFYKDNSYALDPRGLTRGFISTTPEALISLDDPRAEQAIKDREGWVRHITNAAEKYKATFPEKEND